jgi:hypothetical protein
MQGICDLIKRAKTPQEVKALLIQGMGFNYAQRKTKDRILSLVTKAFARMGKLVGKDDLNELEGYKRAWHKEKLAKWPHLFKVKR